MLFNAATDRRYPEGRETKALRKSWYWHLGQNPFDDHFGIHIFCFGFVGKEYAMSENVASEDFNVLRCHE